MQQAQFHKYLKIICGNCNAPLETTIYFSEQHKIYAVDVTDRNVTFSKTVKIQGLAHATTLHLKDLVYVSQWLSFYLSNYGNIWFHDGMTTGRIPIKEGKFGTVSQPNLKVCRNKQLCLVIYRHKS